MPPFNGLSLLPNLLVVLITDHYHAVLGAGVALGAAQLGNYAGPGASDAGAEDGGLEVNYL